MGSSQNKEVTFVKHNNNAAAILDRFTRISPPPPKSKGQVVSKHFNMWGKPEFIRHYYDESNQLYMAISIPPQYLSDKQNWGKDDAEGVKWYKNSIAFMKNVRKVYGDQLVDGYRGLKKVIIVPVDANMKDYARRFYSPTKYETKNTTTNMTEETFKLLIYRHLTNSDFELKNPKLREKIDKLMEKLKKASITEQEKVRKAAVERENNAKKNHLLKTSMVEEEDEEDEQYPSIETLTMGPDPSCSNSSEHVDMNLIISQQEVPPVQSSESESEEILFSIKPQSEQPAVPEDVPNHHGAAKAIKRITAREDRNHDGSNENVRKNKQYLKALGYDSSDYSERRRLLTLERLLSALSAEH